MPSSGLGPGQKLRVHSGLDPKEEKRKDTGSPARESPILLSDI